MTMFHLRPEGGTKKIPVRHMRECTYVWTWKRDSRIGVGGSEKGHKAQANDETCKILHEHEHEHEHEHQLRSDRRDGGLVAEPSLRECSRRAGY